MIIGKVVIYKALHEGDVNLKVRIAEPLRNEDSSTAICLHLWHSVNENKCITAVRIQPKLLTKIMGSTTFESFVVK